MNPLLLDLIPYVRQGYCCSQLLLALALQATAREEEPGLMRALRGLCHGIGQSGAPCGLLSGGAAVLAWLSSNNDVPPPMLDAMLNDYAVWFIGRTAPCGGYGCELVSHGLATQAGVSLPEDGMPSMDLCGELLAECWEKIMDIHDEYQLDNLRN